MSYSCWKLTEACRTAMLEQFPAEFPDVVAHHVTHAFPSKVLPPAASIEIVAEMVDPDGVQVMLVTVDTGDGPREQRPDGRTYHITWSIDRSAGKKPVHSNDVVVSGMPIDYGVTAILDVAPAIEG